MRFHGNCARHFFEIYKILMHLMMHVYFKKGYPNVIEYIDACWSGFQLKWKVFMASISQKSSTRQWRNACGRISTCRHFNSSFTILSSPYWKVFSNLCKMQDLPFLFLSVFSNKEPKLYKFKAEVFFFFFYTYIKLWITRINRFFWF